MIKRLGQFLLLKKAQDLSRLRRSPRNPSLKEQPRNPFAPASSAIPPKKQSRRVTGGFVIACLFTPAPRGSLLMPAACRPYLPV